MLASLAPTQMAEVGKCGFVGEVHVAPQSVGGTSGTVNFSTDAKQSCMYVADLVNDVVYVINRENLTELERFGGGGRQAGEFHWPHMVSCRFRGKYLCRRGRWRRESSEVPALWFDGLQRHRQSGCGQVHPVKVECLRLRADVK